VTLTHFISVASDNYLPASHQKIWYDLDLDYLWPPHQGRSIPLREILSVLTSDSSNYTKANLLYGVCENTGLITPVLLLCTKVVLPASEFKAHTSLLILGLCFLVEVGTLYVNIGMYKKLVTSLDSKIPYIIRVHQLANFEYQLWVPVLPNTFFFAPMCRSKLVWSALVWTMCKCIESTIVGPMLIGKGYKLAIFEMDPTGWQFNYCTDLYWCPYSNAQVYRKVVNSFLNFFSVYTIDI